MTMCNTQLGIDQYFFNNGFFYDDELNLFFDAFERLGVVYVSRNRKAMIVKDSKFTNNVGTFGGAITINSPNWQEGITPYVAIINNQFSNNMAYFSGNAIYIRSTVTKLKASTLNCGGVHLS